MSQPEPSPIEDLYQEHGLLNRLLIIYEYFAQELDHKEVTEIDLLWLSASIIRTFIENHHEQNEEKYIFPKVKRCPKYASMVDELIKQHRISRSYTDRILSLSHQYKDTPKVGSELAGCLRDFVYMYRAHESREDTIIFKSFRELSLKQEFDQLGETMEKEEEKLPVGDFDKILEHVITMEKTLGLYDLNHFTKELQ